MRWLVVAIAIAIAIAARARPAEACSPSGCVGGFFTPGDGATVPANLPAIAWSPVEKLDGSPTDPAKVTLTAADGTTVPLAAKVLPDRSYLLVLVRQLVAGQTYTLVDGNTCANLPGPRSKLTASEAVPLPVALGTLTSPPSTVGELEVTTRSGSCSSKVQAARAPIELALSADARPWRDALQVATDVDGKAWMPTKTLRDPVAPGTSWVGRGKDLLFAVCSSDDTSVDEGLATGQHIVKLRATLPGGSATLVSSPVRVELSCHEAPVAVDAKPLPAVASSSTTRLPWLVLAGGVLLAGVGIGALVLRRRRAQAG